MPQDETLLFVFFTLFILLMLALDLGVFNRKAHAIGVKEATIWSIVWVSLALIFNTGILYFAGAEPALQFFTGYLIEKALSVDNIFVFVLIFSYFGVPQHLQHRILFWGVLGALVMRSIFIAAGAALIQQFDWVFYVFGTILVVSGWKMMRSTGVQVHPEKNLFVQLARKLFPVETGYSSPAFFVRRDGRLHVTSMFLVLITVETTDIIFAVDSIPAIFGITSDPFIVFSSNIFAILGLRSLYFLLAGVMSSFFYLGHGLSVVLMFIGVKMLLADFLHIPVAVSLVVVTGIIGIAVVASLKRKKSVQR
ncbi:MAG: TerC family protein [Ignavibacteria bacterium]|nr:TerC family protein [Ignavibacteria bacterium]